MLQIHSAETLTDQMSASIKSFFIANNEQNQQQFEESMSMFTHPCQFFFSETGGACAMRKRLTEKD